MTIRFSKVGAKISQRSAILPFVLGDVRAEIALRNSLADVGDVLEERVAESLGPFQQGTHHKKKRFKIYARSARTSPNNFSATSTA